MNRLLEKKLSQLPPDAQQVLSALAFFPGAVPEIALEYLAPKTELIQILSMLDRENLIETRTGDLPVNRYSLHPVLRSLGTLKTREKDPLPHEELARYCRDRAVESHQQGLFQLSDELSDCAVWIYRQLITVQGREELLNDLARALTNRGVALRSLGQPDRALGCYNRAIEIRRSLITNGRGELADELAVVIVNKGHAFRSFGRLRDALACYNEAIENYLRLVKAGRPDLANDLAKTLMNKGVTLSALGRMSESFTCYEQATKIRRQLVDLGRRELRWDLAMALMHQGAALNALGRSEEARSCYDEAIDLQRNWIEAEGLTHLWPSLLRATHYRVIAEAKSSLPATGGDGPAEPSGNEARARPNNFSRLRNRAAIVERAPRTPGLGLVRKTTVLNRQILDRRAALMGIRNSGRLEPSMDLAQLAGELLRLRQAMKKAETMDPEHDIAISEIARAEQAARAQNGSEVTACLRAAGQWALDFASETGASVVVEAIKQSMRASKGRD
ncbi:MAG TPA: tetratricopeptide repeat protein [Blastocatellia bacterium]|nr:tetratricopeptide repeat protein [Blastocatellia bacterium]